MIFTKLWIYTNLLNINIEYLLRKIKWIAPFYYEVVSWADIDKLSFSSRTELGDIFSWIHIDVLHNAGPALNVGALLFRVTVEVEVEADGDEQGDEGPEVTPDSHGKLARIFIADEDGPDEGGVRMIRNMHNRNQNWWISISPPNLFPRPNPITEITATTQ